MFKNLSQRLSETIKKVSNKNHLTEDNIKNTLRDVRKALLEADVALPVVKSFIDKIKEKSIGLETNKNLTPGQTFLKIVEDELKTTLGSQNEGLNLSSKPPVVILVAGLQGAGKTTSVAKLARYLIENQKKSVALASADVYRPGAIEQLSVLSQNVGASFFSSNSNQKPIDIAKDALDFAKKKVFDILIIDTAGRLAIDEAMMAEISALHKFLNPIETLFVVDAMTGQDAVNTAKIFDEALSLTGVILTKVDSDVRGGAALSVRAVTGKPIKFLGVGEKTEALEVFHPDRLASRILGMGDMMSLIEDVEKKIDKRKAHRLSKKIKRGKSFDLSDFRDQLQQMNKMGGMGDMLEKIPGMSGLSQVAEANLANRQFGQMEAIINSMTPKERRSPDILNGSRKRRIVQGSGTQIQDLNRLLKQHKQMQKMMKKMKKGGMANLMRGISGNASIPGFPPNLK
jgi:signal recognition particle subunit SRP54